MARRWLLWGALVLLVSALLVTLVWLARRYEAGRLQERIELDAVDVAGDIRSRLARNVQNLLLQESNLWRVLDPGAGAGAIESQTDRICHPVSYTHLTLPTNREV